LRIIFFKCWLIVMLLFVSALPFSPRVGNNQPVLAPQTHTKNNNQPVWPVVATTRKKKTKQINNHPVRQPLVTAHGHKQEKTHSSCAAACHGRKRGKTQSNCAACCGRKQRRTINLSGLSHLQEEEKKNYQSVS